MTLDRYLATRFLKTFAGAFLAFFAVIALVGLIDEVRRHADDGGGLGPVVGLALLAAPGEVYPILPLIVMVAAIALFLGLSRSSELAVTRAAGRSALRSLLPPGLMTLLVGALAVAAFDPIVAATTREYAARVGRLEGLPSLLAVSDDGLWLGQGGRDGQTIIRADRSNADGTVLWGVTFLAYDAKGRPVRRVEARSAHLESGHWQLGQTKTWALDSPNPEADAKLAAATDLPSSLTPEQIRDSFGTPASVSIWNLPRFIRRLEDAGFAAQRHRVHLWTELLQPFFLLAMMLIAAGFTLRHQRGRRVGVMALGAVLTGFAAFVLRNLATVMGEAGQVPPPLAAAAPPMIAIALALGLLLHLEDG